jgi:gamma-glutamyltranspeptidase/glutathione hydrolase
VTVTSDVSTFGLGQAIWRLPARGYVAGSDPRGDGLVAAY